MGVSFRQQHEEDEARERCDARPKDARGVSIYLRSTVVYHTGHGRLGEGVVIVLPDDQYDTLEVSGAGRMPTNRVAVVY